MWLLFALLAALIFGGNRIYEKKLTGTFGNFAMGFIVKAFAVFPMLLFIFIIPGGTEIGSLPWTFWWPLLIIWLILYPVQTYFLYRAIREGEVSVVTPVMALSPVFGIITSFILLGEIPSVLGFMGIILIVWGTYLILKTGSSGNKFSVPVLLMVGSVFCAALGSSLDKISIEVSNPVFYSFVNTLGAALIFFILMHYYKEKHSFAAIRAKFWQLVLLGVLLAVAFVSAMYAFKYGQVSYALAIRSGGFILAGLYGIFILKESISNRKIIAIILFSLGVLALAFA